MGGWLRYQQKEINNDILISYGYGDGGGGPTREMLEPRSAWKRASRASPRCARPSRANTLKSSTPVCAANRRLPTWEGELYFEYHRGTQTSMGRNKRGNRKSELGMMDLELLSVLAAPALDYPKAEIDDLWHRILLNQFHDILPGSSIHEVYEVTKQDYAEIAAKIDTLTEARLQALTPAGDGVTVFNTTGLRAAMSWRCPPPARRPPCATPRATPTRCSRPPKARLPSWAACRRRATRALRRPKPRKRPPPSRSAPTAAAWKRRSMRFVSNEFGQIAALFDKDAAREVFKPGQAGNALRVFEDKPIYYDNWDIDVYYTEKSWDLTDCTVFNWTETGPVRATLHIERSFSHSKISQDIHFYKDTRRIDFVTTVDWHEHQHLLKVFFPADVHTDQATFDIQSAT